MEWLYQFLHNKCWKISRSPQILQSWKFLNKRNYQDHNYVIFLFVQIKLNKDIWNRSCFMMSYLLFINETAFLLNNLASILIKLFKYLNMRNSEEILMHYDKLPLFRIKGMYWIVMHVYQDMQNFSFRDKLVNQLAKLFRITIPRCTL